MVNYYQPFLLPFLSRKHTRVAPEVRRLYYHSFEDALWDLLAKKGIAKGSAILIPNFYCMDVVGNIKNHGYTPVYYPVDAHLQPESRRLSVGIKKYSPAAIILFHAAGITNAMLTPSFVRENAKIIIIEDAVHRLINPSRVRLFGNNHFLIDSLRKVSPLPGSFLYGTIKGFGFIPSRRYISWYSMSSSVWFALFKLLEAGSTLTNNARLASFAHMTVLKKHDDIIGDSHVPHRGLPIIGWLTQWFNYDNVAKKKSQQAALYASLVPKRKHLYPLNIPKRDFPKLHVFPVGIRQIPAGFNNKLLKHNLAVWCKFEDSPWARRYHVLFLPLGFHISDEEIKKTMRVLAA